VTYANLCKSFVIGLAAVGCTWRAGCGGLPTGCGGWLRWLPAGCGQLHPAAVNWILLLWAAVGYVGHMHTYCNTYVSTHMHTEKKVGLNRIPNFAEYRVPVPSIWQREYGYPIRYPYSLFSDSGLSGLAEVMGTTPTEV